MEAVLQVKCLLIYVSIWLAGRIRVLLYLWYLCRKVWASVHSVCRSQVQWTCHLEPQVKVKLIKVVDMGG